MYDIDLKDLLISGESIGSTSNNCVLAVFLAEKGQVNAWYVGAIGFNFWYFVFDMSQYDESPSYNKLMPRIGIAWKNDQVNII